MTTTKEPYWVQIELDSRGNQTAAVIIDFTKVQRVKVIRKFGKLETVHARYDNEVMVLEQPAATRFMDLWEDYQPLRFEDPPAEYSQIEIADTTHDAFKLNTSR